MPFAVKNINNQSIKSNAQVGKAKYTLVIPVYNEAKILRHTIETTHQYLAQKKLDFELIIADDGSVDQSSAIVHELQKQYHSLRLVNNEKNYGRGSALTKAFFSAQGTFLLYIDADLAINFQLFDALEKALTEGNDIAICSKHLPESSVEYPKMRRFASKCYSLLVQFLFALDIKDYQCGFKAFRKDVIEKVLPMVESKGWSWDTEILIRSHLAGYKIKEIPAKVINIYERESTVHLLKDSFEMGLCALNLFWKLKWNKVYK